MLRAVAGELYELVKEVSLVYIVSVGFFSSPGKCEVVQQSSSVELELISG